MSTKTFSLRGIAFEWHIEKAAANQTKHGVDFETACQAFFDPFFLILDADLHSGERRQAVIGLTTAWRLLFVVFLERLDEIRVISARPATRLERCLYETQ